MPTLNITKRYNKKSPLAGIIVTDKLQIEREALASFLRRAAFQSSKLVIDYDIIDHSWAISDKDTQTILVNPTGGKIGKL